MFLKTIKTPAETGLTGVEFVMVDKKITEVVIGSFHIRKGESYSKGLEVLVEAPFDTADRYRMTAKLDGFTDAVSFHDTNYEADVAGNNLTAKGAQVTVEKVECQIEANGDVVAVAAGSASETEFVPF